MENWQKREMRRSKVIEEAAAAADLVILDGSDGSVEETEYLTMMVTKKFMDKCWYPVLSRINKKDFDNDNKN